VGQQVVWVSVSPGLRGIDRPLCRAVQPWVERLWRWDYEQTLDEGADLAGAVSLLIGYLQTLEEPVHLLGHGLSGVVAGLAAQGCPEQVRSLALLGVSPQGVTWHSHYYVQRRLLMGSRNQVLLRLSRSLFGDPHPFCWRSLVEGLADDLDRSPCPYSLWHLAGEVASLTQVPVPVFIGGSWDDPVVDPTQWQKVPLKAEDQVWLAAQGRHFFHVSQAVPLAKQMAAFWSAVLLKPAGDYLLTG